MKILLTCSFIIACFCFQNANAQTSSTYCGLSYSYDDAGNRIQRIVTADCSDHHEMMVVTDTTTKDSVSALTETLYPNPTSGLFYMVFNNAINDAQLVISDNLGRQLMSTTISGNTIPMDISTYADGLYFITVRIGGESYKKAVVKN
jgi:hypothetical protein